MRYIAPFLLCILSTADSFSQSTRVGIGTVTPASRAALEIRADSAGLLIPRLTAAQRVSLTTVPQGLLVYQTDGTAGGGAQTGFWYYSGSGGWVYLDAGSLTLPYAANYGGSSGTVAFNVTHSNGGIALQGAAPNTGVGVYGSSSTGSGVYGTANGSGGYGLRGSATGANSTGVLGTSTGSSNTYGVIGDGIVGVQGQGSSSYGVIGLSSTGTGIYGITNATTGNVAGVQGTANGASTMNGVLGSATSGTGVRGTTTSGTGVAGASSTGSGVVGTSSAFSATLAGVQGVSGSGSSSVGVLGTTTNGYGVYGAASATSGYGVTGTATDAYGVYGISNSGTGVHGTTSANSTTEAGVKGTSFAGSSSIGVLGTVGTGYGVRGEATGSPGAGIYGSGNGGANAGIFVGNVSVAGTLSKTAGSFKIDHPLDPENKYLYHSFVESPDMLNVYNGNVVLDAAGEAVVHLPDWFEALNRDFCYQLTCVGAFMPVFVREEIRGNQFRIAGGTAGSRVSWQVTGIRRDKYADAHRIPVEEAKAAEDRGHYLAPDVYGQPASKGIGYRKPDTPRGRPAIK